MAVAAAVAAETRKHIANDKVPRVGLATCSHCCGDIWQLGSRGKADIFTIGISSGYCLLTTKSKVIADLYGCLNLTLMRAIARAILVRAFRPIRLFS